MITCQEMMVRHNEMICTSVHFEILCTFINHTNFILYRSHFLRDGVQRKLGDEVRTEEHVEEYAKQHVEGPQLRARRRNVKRFTSNCLIVKDNKYSLLIEWAIDKDG